MGSASENTNRVPVQDESVPVGLFRTFNFVGAGVVASDAGNGIVNITIGGSTTAWLYQGNTVTSEKYIGTNDAFDFPIYTSGTRRITVKATGFTGFRTTAPGSTVHILSDNTVTNTLDALTLGSQGTGATPSYTGIMWNCWANSFAANPCIHTYAHFDTINDADSRFTIATRNGSGGFQDTLSCQLGKVGIGTIAPAYTLDVKKDVDLVANTCVLRLTNTGTGIAGNYTQTGIIFNASVGNNPNYNTARIYAQYDGTNAFDGRLSFQVIDGVGAFAEVMSVKNQAVGIGTILPSASLHVLSTDNTTNTFALKIYNSTPVSLFTFRNDGTWTMGLSAIATGSNSFAMGNGATTAAYTGAIALGRLATAGANTSIIIGDAANGVGICIGVSTTNTSDTSTVVGNGAGASNVTSNVYGVNATSSASRGVVNGYGATNSGYGGIAVGYLSACMHDFSIALGRYATTTASNQFVIGNTTDSSEINNMFVGRGVSAIAANLGSFTLNATGVTAGVSDSSAATSEFIFAGARGTGTGLGGDIIFKVATAGATGSTQNALVETMRLRENGGINMALLQTGNAGLASGDLYVDTAANILANADLIVARKV